MPKHEKRQRRNWAPFTRHDTGPTAFLDGRADGPRWVNANNGHARDQWGDLLVKTQVKWAWVPVGFWVGCGYIGQFWVISHKVFVGCYDPAEGDDHNAVLDRDDAAALVVAADEIMAQSGECVDLAVFRGWVARMDGWVHQLATSAEALR